MSRPYLPSLVLRDYLHAVATLHPHLRGMLDFGRPGAAEALAELAATVSEFDTDSTGRGDSYRRAQRDTLVRWTGMRQLLELATPADAEPVTLILDVLGGDGTVARAASGQSACFESKLAFVTGDVSGHMVDRALAHGLPAVRQAAHFLFLRDGSVDAVLLAYGTHHIPAHRRPPAVAEAARVVRPGGRIVLHDFDESSPMAGFFAEVVHPHAAGGHDYRHFTRAELAGLFADAGLPVRVVDLYDPLIVRADTERAAYAGMRDYVGDMYGVRDFFTTIGDDAVWRLLTHHFDHTGYLTAIGGRDGIPVRPVVYRADGQFVAEVPRMAIVATATRTA
ncbi:MULTISPECIES: class I SAM-dependent methyltransferase [unclassified Micromonospora]|uniref:class I SAM-dependent methyltransferase n=1 Tax=unclassified Micromonospora TaxID=2617518 RepID=UPI0022BBF6CC|nr:class I SAM-dependent methyltransferase [Micromonospora sp. AKA38]GHJ15466.1 SAM-dependent methyltransferase [Micromonospora sp. AKA38]